MIRLVRASDQAFLVVFDDAMTQAAGVRVRRLHAWLAREPIVGLVDLHPAYATLLVRFNALECHPDAIEREIKTRVLGLDDHPAPEPRSFDIPVRYGGEFGPDLAQVAAAVGLSEAEVVAAHAGATYQVRFLGFSSGFPYLEGLPESLVTARRQTPRRRVAAGSVALASGQAGIYPLASPGGWNVIGRTELVLFDVTRPSPALLAAGDVVRFVPSEPAR